MPSARTAFSTTAAKASLISNRSMSFTVMPAFFSAFCAAGRDAGEHDGPCSLPITA